jgi:hypothetical protein
VTLKYSDELGYDEGLVAAANRAYDQRTGFNVKYPGDGTPRLQYPPYVPALPGYEVPVAGRETQALSAAIFAWHERWAGAAGIKGPR